MDNFGIMLKSYGPDLPYARRFLKSFLTFSTELIPLYVVVPDQDVAEFKQVFGTLGEVLPESLWSDYLVSYPIHGNTPGYINQKIIKLAFGEKNYLANYLCAESKAMFIRPFTRADFMADRTTPFTFLTEDHELQVDPIYFNRYGRVRSQSLGSLREQLGLPPTPIATCQNMAVISSKAVDSLVKYMTERTLSYANLMEISPYEFSWYNFWLERELPIQRVVREPIFEMIHMPHQHLGYALKGINLEDLTRGYVGVVLNSAISGDHGVLDFDPDFIDALARNLSYKALAGGIIERALQRVPRVRKIFKV
jgi:hypothetical protein